MKLKVWVVIGCLVAGIAAVGILYLGGAFFSSFAGTKGLSNNGNLGFYLGLGEVTMEQGLYPVSEMFFRQALKQAEKCDPNKNCRAEALTRIGQCLFREDKLPEAIQAFESAVKLHREFDDESPIVFSTDRKMRLLCLTEYKEALKRSGQQKTADALNEEIEHVKDDIASPPSVLDKLL